jgi:hypothetical protein
MEQRDFLPLLSLLNRHRLKTIRDIDVIDVLGVATSIHWGWRSSPTLLMHLPSGTCYQSSSSCLAYIISSKSVKAVYLYSSPLFILDGG